MSDNRPQLYSDLELPYAAGEELATARVWRYDGVPMGIPSTEIEAYLNLNLIEGDDYRYDTYRAIRVIDLLWLDIRNKKLNKKRGGNSSSSD